MQVVDLAVLDLEVAPERAAQPARLGPILGLRRVQRLREDRGSRRAAAPTRPSPRTSRSGRRRGRSGGWSASHADGVTVVSQSAFASSASKNRSTQRPSPQQCCPRRRPRPELLAVVAHHPDPRAVLGRVLAQVVDDLLDVAERDPVAEPLLGPEDRQEPALVLGACTGPQRSSSGIAAARKCASSRIVQA